MTKAKVRIVGKHPHAGRCGTMDVHHDGTVTGLTVCGAKMFKVSFDDDLPVDACYAEKENIQVIR